MYRYKYCKLSTSHDLPNLSFWVRGQERTVEYSEKGIFVYTEKGETDDLYNRSVEFSFKSK